MSYRSPIESIYGNMELKFENEVLKAIQSVNINVNREELMMALAYDRQQYEKGYSEGYSDSKAESHWIPCSERLPERGKNVLVTRNYDGREDFNKSCRYVEVASCYGEDDDIVWSSYSDEYKMTPRNHHVIAWMPLPESYREDGDGT